MNHPVYC